jgi:hypothetical protein
MSSRDSILFNGGLRWRCMDKRILTVVMLSLLFVGALGAEKPTVNEQLRVHFMFDEIEIDKEELRMQSVIDYIEDNELGNTSELEKILGKFADIAADLEAYLKSEDPTEDEYKEIKDELHSVVDDFRVEARSIVTDEDERNRIRSYVDLQVVNKIDKYAEKLANAKEELKKFYLSSFDWVVEEEDRILTELENAGIDVSDLREKLDKFSAKRDELEAALDNLGTVEAYGIELQKEIQEMFAETQERAKDYWASVVIGEAEKGIAKARDTIDGIKANATAQGIELDFDDEEDDLDDLEDEIKSLKGMDITDAQAKYKDEIEPEFKKLATRIVMKIYLESASAITTKTRAEFAKAVEKAEREGVDLDFSDEEDELEALEEEIKSLQPLIEAGDYKLAEEKFKEEIQPKYKELEKRFVVKIYLAYSDMLISKMRGEFEKIEAELESKGITVDLSDEYAKLEEIEDEFDELRSLIDEGNFKEMEEQFKDTILPKYEKLGLRAYVAVMDAVANKMIGDSRKALNKFKKDLKVFDVDLDLSEQEEEIDEFEERLEEVKVLIRENKTVEADREFKKVEADFKIFWKKGGAKLKLAGVDKWIETWEKVISAAETAGLDTADMEDKLDEIKDVVKEARASYEDGDYEDAADQLEPLEAMFKELEALLPKKGDSEVI